MRPNAFEEAFTLKSPWNEPRAFSACKKSHFARIDLRKEGFPGYAKLWDSMREERLIHRPRRHVLKGALPKEEFDKFDGNGKGGRRYEQWTNDFRWLIQGIALTFPALISNEKTTLGPTRHPTFNKIFWDEMNEVKKLDDPMSKKVYGVVNTVLPYCEPQKVEHLFHFVNVPDYMHLFSNGVLPSNYTPNRFLLWFPEWAAIHPSQGFLDFETFNRHTEFFAEGK